MEKRTSPVIRKKTMDGKHKSTFYGLLCLLIISPLLMGGLCCSGSNESFFNPNSNNSENVNLADRTFTQLYMLDEKNGWATTAESVLKTSDGGKSWIDVTPTDWEPLPVTPAAAATAPDSNTQKAISGIDSATFLDVNHAWIVATTPLQQSDINAQMTAVPSEVSKNSSGTVTVNSKALPSNTTSVYVRSTVDGGKNWVTSNALTLKNIDGVSQPDFINPHEGWLEVITEDSQNNQTVGLLFASVDGGITWHMIPSLTPLGGVPGPASIDCTLLCSGIGLTPRDLPEIQTYNDNGALTGMSILPDCISEPGNSTSQQLQQCPPSSTDQTLGCTVPPTVDYVGAATGTFTSKKLGSVYLDSQSGLHAWWHPIFPIAAPGGAPQENKTSFLLSEPPIMFANNSGILPIEIENTPDPNNASNGATPPSTFLHLYGLASGGAGKGYALFNLSPTSQFSIQEVSRQHTLSALDVDHVFVIGQDYSTANQAATPTADGLSGGQWRIYEFTGKQWLPLTNNLDASITIPQDNSQGGAASTPGNAQASVLSAALGNLDMISPTEGWATSGTVLYHLAIAGTTVTWSQVYPAANQVATATATGSAQFVTPIRVPGAVIPAPQNPSNCAGPPPPPVPGGGNSGTSNAVTHTLSFVNNTNQTIWVGASGQAASTVRPVGTWNGELAPGQAGKLTVSTPGAIMENMRFWGRTGCNSQGTNCDTGDCGAGGLCNGAGGAVPTSLSEFTFNGANGLVYYDVSFVDGYNLPMLIHSSGGPGPDNCGNQACTDMNSVCPSALQVQNTSGQVVACKSDCTADPIDQYCCLGQYVEGVCNPNNPAVWPNDKPNWPKLVKPAYPHAYSFPDDDTTSTYTCSETCDITTIFGLSATSAQQGGSPGADDNLTAHTHSSTARS